MTDNRTFWKALHSLVHPLSLMAILLLLFNDHWLRYAHPSWLTGKLGDFTWLVFAPFITALLLAWIIPQRWKQHSRIVGWLSIGFIGIWFATAKTIPFVHELTTQTLYAIVGWQGQLRLDITDLLTLPALLISWHIWRTASDEKVSLKPLAYVAFGLGMLGTLASDSPQYPDYGIRSICSEDDFLFITTMNYWGQHNNNKSNNGGLTWRSFDADGLECFESSNNKPIGELKTDLGFQVRWVQADKIGISYDEGKTWKLDYDFIELRQEIRYLNRRLNHYHNGNMYDKPGPYDAILDHDTGNIVFAMGWDGILVKRADGTYEWVEVNNYGVPPIADLSNIYAVIPLELWLTLANVFLIITTSSRFIRHRDRSKVNGYIKFSWIMYAIILIFVILERFNPVAGNSLFPYAYPELAGLISLPTLIVLGIPLSIGAVWDILRNFRSVALPIALAGLGNGALFIFPFLLWTQGRIPRYVTAYAFSVLLTLLGLYATRIYLKRVLPILEPEKMKRDTLEKDKKTKPS